MSLSVEGGLRSSLSWRALVYVNRYEDERWVRFSAGASQQERDTDETHRGARAIVSWRPQVAALSALGDVAIEGGVDTERQDNTSLRYTTTERNRVSQTRDQAWRFNITGAFVQAVIKPTDTVKLVPGYRIDRITGDFRQPPGRHFGRHQRLRHDQAAEVQRRVDSDRRVERLCQLGPQLPGRRGCGELQDPAGAPATSSPRSTTASSWA